MIKNNFPTISVVTATFNSGKLLAESLKRIRSQNYPQSRIEIILGDGGSTDNTKQIAKIYQAKIINIPTNKQHAEYNRGVAYNQAKNELVLILDHDNFLPYKNWLRDMVKPFKEHTDLVAVESCYYTYDKKFNIIDRYSALFGTNEPLPYYLGKADRMPQTAKSWVLQGKAIDCGDYYLVEFEKDPRKIPSIGTNGCLMRRSLVNKYADIRPDYHYPIDVMVDVIKSGHNKFGFVKNSITHNQQFQGLIPFLTRRFKFADKYHFEDLSKRRWSVFMDGDQLGVIRYIFYSITFIKPTYDAIMGFIQIPDIAWFLHPLMCLGTTFLYGYAVLKHKLI